MRYYLPKTLVILLKTILHPNDIRKIFKKLKIHDYTYLWETLDTNFYAGISRDNEYERGVWADRVVRECRAIPGFPLRIGNDGVSTSTATFFDKIQEHKESQGTVKADWKLTVYHGLDDDIEDWMVEDILLGHENELIEEYNPIANIRRRNLNVGHTKIAEELFPGYRDLPNPKKDPLKDET